MEWCDYLGMLLLICGFGACVTYLKITWSLYTLHFSVFALILVAISICHCCCWSSNQIKSNQYSFHWRNCSSFDGQSQTQESASLRSIKLILGSEQLPRKLYSVWRKRITYNDTKKRTSNESDWNFFIILLYVFLSYAYTFVWAFEKKNKKTALKYTNTHTSLDELGRYSCS